MDELDQLLDDLSATPIPTPAPVAAARSQELVTENVPEAVSTSVTVNNGSQAPRTRVDLSELDDLVSQLGSASRGTVRRTVAVSRPSLNAVLATDAIATARANAAATAAAAAAAPEPAQDPLDTSVEGMLRALEAAVASTASTSIPAQAPAKPPTPAAPPPATPAEPLPAGAVGVCDRCKKPAFSDNNVTALGKVYHKEHFCCQHCLKPLDSLTFFDRSSQPYCEKCHNDLFVPKCAYCDSVIRDTFLTALGKTWHVDHFFCSQCGKSFPNGDFMENDGKAYCQEDFFNMFAPKCAGCNLPVMAEFITALNLKWHTDCFVCADCNDQFANGRFFEHEGRPYCERHYNSHRGTICGACQKPIVGRCVTALNKRFHPEHFVCSYCSKQLIKGTFKEENNKAYCGSCHIKLYQ